MGLADGNTSGFSAGVARIVNGNLHFYLDENSDLVWNPPPDFIGQANAFGIGTDFVPASHTHGLAVQRGSTVYFDINNNHVWNNTDATISNVISSNYELVGVEKE